MHANEVKNLDDLTAFVTERGYSPTDVAMAIEALRQPAPTGESGYEGSVVERFLRVDVGDLDPVYKDLYRLMKERADFGFQKYGKYLHTHNGRDAWKDLQDEVVDGIAYFAQLVYEKEITPASAQRIMTALVDVFKIARGRH